MSQSNIIAIRRADPQGTDWQNVLELVLAAFAYMEDRIDPASSAYRLTGEAIRTQSEEGIVLLAEARAGLVDCVFLTQRPDVMCLGKLAVETARQGQAIGRQLFEVAADAARVEGYREVELQARVDLPVNYVAFAAMGFRETRWTAHSGYDLPTSVTMRCVL